MSLDKHCTCRKQVTRQKWTGCVLEIKFTDRFPSWTQELVQTFNLRRTSMPKYVECVDAARRMGSLNLVMGRGIG